MLVPNGTSLAQTLDSVSSSAAAASNSKPKTPIIAGSICGGVLGLAWIIGFAIYFRKRYKRKLRNEGKLPPLESKKVKEESQEKIVIPPDPAILFGRRAEEHYPRSERAEAPSATSLPPDKSPDGPSNESLNQYTSARPANSVNRNEE